MPIHTCPHCGAEYRRADAFRKHMDTCPGALQAAVVEEPEPEPESLPPAEAPAPPSFTPTQPIFSYEPPSNGTTIAEDDLVVDVSLGVLTGTAALADINYPNRFRGMAGRVRQNEGAYRRYLAQIASKHQVSFDTRPEVALAGRISLDVASSMLEAKMISTTDDEPVNVEEVVDGLDGINFF